MKEVIEKLKMFVKRMLDEFNRFASKTDICLDDKRSCLHNPPCKYEDLCRTNFEGLF